MQGWQKVRTVLVFEMKREWIGLIATSLFAVYFGAVFIFIVEQDANGELPFMSAMRDWIYLFAFPLFGCMMHRTVFHYWRQDPFTKRVAHWRTMPVPISAIAGARYAQSLLTHFAAGGLFLTLQYIVSSDLRAIASASEWIAAGLVWFAYGVLIQAFYVYLELGFPGKTFVLYYTAYTVLAGVVSALVAVLGGSLFRELLAVVKENPVLSVSAALIVAAAALAAGYRLTTSRMRTRRYSF